MAKFAIKKIFKPIKYKRYTNKGEYKPTTTIKPKEAVEEVVKLVEEKPIEEVKVTETIIEDKKVNDMDTKEKITYANAILAKQEETKVKKVRKDKGLIERTESSKIVLTEDNKELLND